MAALRLIKGTTVEGEIIGNRSDNHRARVKEIAPGCCT
jgi:hypothetical protein